MTRTSLSIWGIVLVATVAVFAGLASAQGRKNVIPARVYHTAGGGGLIEGTCVGVRAAGMADVELADGKHLLVPLELFDPTDRQLILDHFEIEAAPLPPRTTPTPFDKQHPWHSIRGGVIATGQIIGFEDSILSVVDQQGNQYRIPFELLAEGAKVHATSAIAQLPGQRKQQVKKKSKAPSSDEAASNRIRRKSAKPNSSPVDVQPNEGDGSNLPPGLAEALKKLSPGESKPVRQDGGPMPNAVVHQWKKSDGTTLAIGRLIEKTGGNLVAIQDQKGQRVEIHHDDLSPADQHYLVLVLAGARIEEPAAPEGKSELPGQSPPRAQGASRHWKLRNGIPFARGTFLELQAGRVLIAQDGGGTMPLPWDLLSDADRQYAEALSKGEKPGELPPGAIGISSDSARLMTSLDPDRLLLFDENQLRILSADGRTQIEQHDLPEGTTQVAERREYYVATAGKNLLLLNKRDLQVITAHELWKIRSIRWLAVHPTQEFAFLSIENALDEIRNNPEERQRIVMVDEKSGEIDELNDQYATWLAVDPTGKYLLAGYRKVTEEFGGLHINPDGNVIRQPKWENTDILRRYQIHAGNIELDEEFRNAGANGQGLVLSPNGRLVAYLSYTGYPTFSGNVCLFSLTDFQKKPIVLEMKDIADCRRLVFHPTLEVAASPGSGSAVLFDTATGDVIEGGLQAPPDLVGAAVHDLIFSGDGRHLVFIVSRGGGAKYIVSAELTLPRQFAVRTKPSPTSKSGGEPPAEVREWTDISQKFKVLAAFAGRDGDKVLLRKSDGTIISLPLSKLSPMDREFVAASGR